MNIDEMSSRLFILRIKESGESGAYYSIAVEGSESGEDSQNLFFSSRDYLITFIEPYAPFYLYLLENEKWLRSILYTTLKIKDRDTISIPFSFPCEEKPRSAPPENSVRVYCDGSCSKNGNGGWGGVIIFHGKDPVEVSGEEPDTTSNRMELAAAVGALLRAESMMKGPPLPVILLTDSHYVIYGVTHRLQVWRKNGFITALGTPVLNRELWEELAAIIERVDVYCVKVDAADNDPHHIRCDEIAGLRMRYKKV